MSEEKPRGRIASIDIDEKSLPPASADADRERKIAVFDLIEDNTFVLVGHDGGPYDIKLSLLDGRLVLEISEQGNPEPVKRFVLALTAVTRTIREYFKVCEIYYDAIRTMSPVQIEAIDMGRRGLHDEGSRLLNDRLKDKVEVDFGTARRLFTLVCALHARS